LSTTTETALPTGTWNVDPVHSTVGFAVDYMAGTFRGSFASIEGRLAVGEDETIDLAGSAKVESVRVQDESLTSHLLSPEFFDAERAPTIDFTGTTIRRSGEDVVVDGELSIKGVTRPVTLTGTISEPFADAYGNDRVVLKLQTTVDRTSFDLNWNLALPNGEPALANDVTLTAELYLVKA
jgi:polyisoprenoid-binding protein YceI